MHLAPDTSDFIPDHLALHAAGHVFPSQLRRPENVADKLREPLIVLEQNDMEIEGRATVLYLETRSMWYSLAWSHAGHCGLWRASTTV